MRNLKKVLALVLTLALALSVAAGAAFTDQKQIKNTEAVDACVALNIIGGYPDGSYKPEGNITRAEFCKMLCVALNGGKEPNLGTSTTPIFNDVRTSANSSWAEKYIEACYVQGIVSGIGGGQFNPNGSVTGTEAAKMLLIALGYKSENEGFTGASWAVNVNVKATAKGLYEGIESMDATKALTRDNAAQMVWNALNAYEVEYKTTLVTENGQLSSQITCEDKLVQGIDGFVKITLLEDKYEAVTEKGILTGVEFNDNDDTYTTTVSGIDEPSFDASKDYSELMGQQVKVMYTEDNKSKDITLLGIYPTEKNKTVTALGDDMDYSDTNKVEINDKDYKLASDIEIVAPNGEAISGAKILDGTSVAATSYYQYTLVDNNNDKTYEYAVVTPFAVAQIDYLTASKLTLSTVGGTSLSPVAFDLKDDDVTLYKDAAEDDYVVVVPAKYTVDAYTLVTKADIVSGKVAATKTDDNSKVTDVKVDGTWYSLADKNAPGDTIKLNDSYDFAVVNGFVFNAEKTKGTVSAENVVYVEKCGALSGGIADGVQAKVWFSDGTTKTVTVTGYTAGPNDSLTVGDSYDIVKTVSTGATDEISNTAAADLIAAGTLFTYSEKNGEYTLEPVYDKTTVSGTSYDNMGSYDKFLSTSSSTSIKDGKVAVNKARFADDAVIFVNDKDGVKIVTGKTVNNWKETTVTGVYGLADKSSGVYYIAVGLITMDTTAKSDAAAYGFITSSISSSKEDGTTYYNFTMWNGTESVDVKVDSADVSKSTLVKYGFVSFDWEDEAAFEADGTNLKVYTASNNATAITAFVTDDSISFAKAATTEGGKTTIVDYDFADTYFVIGVDTKKGEGSTAKLATAKDAPENDQQYCANAVYFLVPDGDKQVVEAVFIDVNGVMTTDKNGDEIYIAK